MIIPKRTDYKYSLVWAVVGLAPTLPFLGLFRIEKRKLRYFLSSN